MMKLALVRLFVFLLAITVSQCGILGALGSVVNGVTNGVTNGVNGAVSGVTDASGAGSNPLGDIVGGLTSASGAVTQVVGGVVGSLTGTVLSITLLPRINQARRNVVPKGSLKDLTWDDTLSSGAMNWAKMCVSDHSDDFYAFKVGETFSNLGLVNTLSTTLALQGLLGWLSQNQTYNYATNECFGDNDCSAYKQLVWEQTTSVGCALNLCGLQSLMVCQFAPVGNFPDVKPYKSNQTDENRVTRVDLRTGSISVIDTTGAAPRSARAADPNPEICTAPGVRGICSTDYKCKTTGGVYEFWGTSICGGPSTSNLCCVYPNNAIPTSAPTPAPATPAPTSAPGTPTSSPGVPSTPSDPSQPKCSPSGQSEYDKMCLCNNIGSCWCKSSASCLGTCNLSNGCASCCANNNVTFAWTSTAYGACSKQCGGGTQTRSVYCVGTDGRSYDAKYCTAAIPVSSVNCNVQACGSAPSTSVVFSWSTGAFGTCSNACGTGTQTRTVVCKGSDNYSYDDSRCSGTKPTTSQTCVTSCRVSAPNPLDWRSVGVVTSVKDQGTCASNWAFASQAIAESSYAIASGGRNVDLSAQQLLNCDKRNNGCTSGTASYSLPYLVANGSVFDARLPYQGAVQACNLASNIPDVIFNATGYVNDMSVNGLVSAMRAHGPLLVYVGIDETWQSYSDGILAGNPTNVNHAVQLVGYVSGSPSYFIIKNSWGTSWGQKGYAYIDATNNCGITKQNAMWIDSEN